LLKAAFNENGGQQKLDFVADGVDLMYYLNQIQGEDEDNGFPDFIMIDLNMPRKNGKEVLKEIKEHPVYKKIPVIIYTTTRDEQEVRRCYELGANNYIVKPTNFETMVKIVNTVVRYWLSTACTAPLNSSFSFNSGTEIE
jgi:DNA-binding response OmpR family regulator